jgi:hypothetical protein
MMNGAGGGMGGMNMQQLMQMMQAAQQAQQQQQSSPNQQTPLAAPADPKSQYLQNALNSMQGKQQGSATGLGENLLADALDQYSLQKRQNQLTAQGNAGMPTNLQAPTANGLALTEAQANPGPLIALAGL